MVIIDNIAGIFSLRSSQKKLTSCVVITFLALVLLANNADQNTLEAAQLAIEAIEDEAAAVTTYAPAPKLTASNYPTIAGVNGRLVVWVVAQLHLWFAALCSGSTDFCFHH